MAGEIADERGPGEPPGRGPAEASPDAIAHRHPGDAVVRVDADGLVETMNAAAVTLFGRTLPAGFPLAEELRFHDERTGETLPELVSTALAAGRQVGTGDHAMMQRPMGRPLAVQGSVTPFVDERTGRASGAVVVLRDASRARAMQRELDYLARFDPLTGLRNRREFERRFRMLLDESAGGDRRHALAILDFDRFRAVNDGGGHLAGDRVLQQVASRLAAAVADGDLLARLGGDQFALLLVDRDEAAAERELRALVEALQELRPSWNGRTFDVTASLGLVPVVAGVDDLATILAAADAACGVAKEKGGNGLHRFRADDPEIGRHRSDLFWARETRRALDEGRLRLHYQLIRPLGAELPEMCELFVRLVGADGAVHRAADFVPAAERFGLAVDLDRWVVRTAFDAIGEATRNRVASGDRALGRIFCVNLSAHSLSTAGFLDFVLGELERAGIFPESVCFEITETAAIQNPESARTLVTSLRELGCRFALDDFGRGLSSFAYLKELKVDLVKIDRDFTRGVADDSVDRALVASVRQVAEAMGLHTVGEGVEDAATLAALRELGVDYAQGDFLHKPQALLR